ncbi:DUF5753 domain-containing protein [Streptomyces avermitilis]
MNTQRHEQRRWDRYLEEGTGRVQDEFLDLVRKTKNSRHYCPNIVWGNLQTEGYARAVLRRVVDFHETHDDVEAGVARRTARAQFLGQGGRTYRALLGEQALRTNLGGTEVMRGQLRHLLQALELTGLKLGIIPARAELALYPGHSFSIFDSRLVVVETFSAGLDVTSGEEVAAYEKAFVWLERSAVYGAEARRLIEAELDAVG